MDHIVYLDKPAGALEAMRRGDKTMVGRAAMGRRSPYGKVNVGDTMYFTENDGRQIVHGRGKVARVYDSPKLTHEESVSLVDSYRRDLWLSEKQYQRWAGKRYLMMVTIADYEELPEFRFTRAHFTNMDDWLLVGDIDTVRKQGPTRELI